MKGSRMSSESTAETLAKIEKVILPDYVPVKIEKHQKKSNKREKLLHSFERINEEFKESNPGKQITFRNNKLTVKSLKPEESSIKEIAQMMEPKQIESAKIHKS